MKRRIFIIIFILIISCTIYFIRNHVRLLLCKNYNVKSSVVILNTTNDEGYFSVNIYDIKRSFYSRSITKVNNLFSDQILVVKIPLTNCKLNNLVLKPQGRDNIQSDADFYFNTLFFMDDFQPMRGLISNKEQISSRVPKKTRMGIGSDGKITIFKNGDNCYYNDVLQAPFTFNRMSNVKNNFNTINYRQFISIKDGSLVYISSNRNSLISWKDVQSVLKDLDINQVIALDGGSSFDYCFEGKKTYSFSSIPFRKIWFYKNSPYYLEGFWQ